ncbi:type IX secretion system membrane protein PorP/SprF [Mangrovibacterium marinum]|uniref:Type IX secretion system PorP/SprF family membrane protein n=1 Tax=Mangrovibacterium marinum TaxID=1639118 RepID=A0A2T5C4B8_9BACT|nr:type IX secretion system membrane protein PorP/SprF [Mangrovibacterium marinum]PTN09647.1 type IX secretion system PorP/SprF family membrane protein [Mangrovibacterium marinum]
MQKIFLIFISLCAFQTVQAQDAEYAQFYANPLYLNPGFAGTTDQTRLSVNYRNQWPQQGTNYTSYSVAIDRYAEKLKGGLGMQAHSSREPNGIVEKTSLNLFYAHHIKFNPRFFFDLGLRAGFTYKKLDYQQLVFPDMINQLTGERYLGSQEIPENASLLYPDFGVGFIGQYDSFYGGIAVDHLSQPDESVFIGDQRGKLPLKFTVHLGAKSYRWHRGLLSRRFTLSPNVIYQQQAAFRQLNLGLYVLERSVSAGLWYRQTKGIQPESVILMLGLMRPKFKIGYSYDHCLSELSYYSYGAHEISLILFTGEKRKSRQTLLIPSL